MAPISVQSAVPQGMLIDGTPISSNPSERSLTDKAVRQMEMIGRAGFEGATGLADIPAAIWNATANSQEPKAPYLQPTIVRALDAIGMPQPEGVGENMEFSTLRGISGGRTLPGTNPMVPLSAGIGAAAQEGAKQGGYSPSVQTGTGLLASMLTGTVNPKNFMGNLGETEAGRLGKILTQNDIPVYAGDILPDGKMKSAVDLIGDLPFSGSTARDAGQQKALNSAVAKQMGMDSNVVNPPLMSKAADQSGDVFKYIGDNYNIAKPDAEKLFDNLADYQNPEIEENADTVAQSKINKQLGNLLKSVDSNGEIPGSTYSSVRSDLGRLARSSTDPDVTRSAYAIQKHLDNAISPSISPDMQDVFSQNRENYRNMLAIEPAVGKNIRSGDIDPASLQQGVSKVYPNYEYNDTASMPQLTQGAQLLKPALQQGATTPMQNLVKQYGWGGDAAQIGLLMGSPVLGPLARALNPKLSLEDFTLSQKQQLAKSLMGAGMGAGINDVYQK